MEQEKINEILEQIKNMQPHAKGNGRICYKVGNYAVLLENENAFKANEQVKANTDKCIEAGITTPAILYNGIHDGKCVMVQEFVEGKQLYSRSAGRLCIQQGEPEPEYISVLQKNVKAEYDNKNNITFADVLDYTPEQKKQYKEAVQKYTDERFATDTELQKKVDYSNEMEQLWREDCEQSAREIANTAQEHFDKFLKDIGEMQKIGLGIDGKPDNFIRCPSKGFVWIDLSCGTPRPSPTASAAQSLKLLCDVLTRGCLNVKNSEQLQKAIADKCLQSAKNLGIPYDVAMSSLPDYLEALIAPPQSSGKEGK